MTPDERERFLAEPRTGVLATVDAKGRAHAVPVWYLFEAGKFLILTDRGSQKHRNIARSGRAALNIQDPKTFQTVTAEGPATITDPLDHATRLRLHTHYRGPEAAAKAVANNAHEHMVAIVVTPERWY
jgi:PPOX class probable F420-dependent enzyme